MELSSMDLAHNLPVQSAGYFGPHGIEMAANLAVFPSLMAATLKMAALLELLGHRSGFFHHESLADFYGARQADLTPEAACLCFAQPG